MSLCKGRSALSALGHINTRQFLNTALFATARLYHCHINDCHPQHQFTYLVNTHDKFSNGFTALSENLVMHHFEKKSLVNNFFLGEYGKLHALLLCAVNVFFSIYCLLHMSLEGHISIGNIRISCGKWQSRLSWAMHLQMSDQLTLCSQQHAQQCTWCHAHCCQQ